MEDISMISEWERKARERSRREFELMIHPMNQVIRVLVSIGWTVDEAIQVYAEHTARPATDRITPKYL
jgi:uncharacterized protein YukE